MVNLYQIDPKALKARTREAQEQLLITLQDDSTRPPPTLGTPPWQGSIFGPWLGQPASRLETFEHEAGSRHGAVNILIGLAALGTMLVIGWLVFR